MVPSGRPLAPNMLRYSVDTISIRALLKPVLQQGRMDGRDGEELEEEDDHVSYIERFKRLWRNERCAPALLPHQEELIEKLKADLEAQVRPRPARACALIAAARLCLSPS